MGVGACRRLATTCWDGTRADFGRQGIGTHGAQALPLVPQGFPESQPKVGRPPPQEPPPSSQETRTQWQNGALSVCDVAWWRACFTPLNATPFAEAQGRLGGQ